MTSFPQHEQIELLASKSRELSSSFRHLPRKGHRPVVDMIGKLLARVCRPITSLLTEVISIQEEQTLLTESNAASVRELTHQMTTLRKYIERLEEENEALNARGKVTEISLTSTRQQLDLDSDPIWDKFYDRFEDTFRGSLEHIRKRLATRYRGHLEELAKSSTSEEPPQFLDLGCGHGEFLDLASECGFETYGVDQSPVAAQVCRNHGHNVVANDMLSFLSKIPDESANAIGMLHVIEHLPKRYTYHVYRQVARVLKKGGVFIVETPSLFSLWAGCRQFYLDPTHLSPVHPDYMAFLAQDCGFEESKILKFADVEGADRAQLSAALPGAAASEMRKLEAWLYGPMDLCCWSVR